MNCVVAAVHKLWARHASEIKQVREESEQNMVNVAFGIKIDCSEAEPTVKTQLKFVSSVTDSVTARLDDANQGRFEFLEPSPSENTNNESEDDAPRKSKSKRKPKPAAEPEAEPITSVDV